MWISDVCCQWLPNPVREGLANSPRVSRVDKQRNRWRRIVYLESRLDPAELTAVEDHANCMLHVERLGRPVCQLVVRQFTYLSLILQKMPRPRINVMIATTQ